MKKLFVTMAIVLTGLVGFSQIPKPQTLSEFSTWSLTPYAAFTFENTDFEKNDPFYKKTPLNTGFGLEVSKQLSHFTSVQLNYFNTELNTESSFNKFNSNVNQFDLRFRLNITNGSVFRKWQSTQLFAYAGYGILFYDATRTASLTGETVYEVNNNTSVIPVGVGAKYRLGNRTSLSFDLSYNQTNTDDLDAWVNALTSKDGFTKATFAFTYNLGKKKILEWDHPYAYLVPESVHDTTVVIQKIEYTPPKQEPIKLDTAIIYYIAKHYQIEETYLDDLDNVLNRAKDENFNIEIMAFCDTSGKQDDNYNLVSLRAEKVRQYANKFISDDRITIYRYDESWATYAPEARNRKVIVRLVK